MALPYKIYTGAGGIDVGAYTNTPNGYNEATPQSIFRTLVDASNNSPITGKAEYNPYLEKLRGYTGGAITPDLADAATRVYQGIYSQSGYNPRFSEVLTGNYGESPSSVASNYTIGPNGEQMTVANAANFSPSPQETARGIAPTGTGTAGPTKPLTQAELDAQNAALGRSTYNTAPAQSGTSVNAPTPAALPIPNVELQPGSSGDNVKQLQDFLVSKGLMTREQVNTGYGIYGSQTQQAVLALQKSLGIDYSSGPGYFGPKTIAALKAQGSTPQVGNTPTQSKSTQPNQPAPTGTNIVQNVIDTYTQVYEKLGLTSVKASYEKALKDQADLTNKMNEEIAHVNEDPWLSQGVKDSRTKRIQDRYETKINTQTHLATLFESIYKEGQDQAKFLVGQIEDDRAAAILAAQKKQDAIDALSKDNDFVTVNGQKLLVNKSTGKTVANLGASTDAGSDISLTNVDRQGLLGVGFTKADIAQIEKDAKQYGLTKVIEGVTDPAQKAALYKVYGATAKVTRDQISQTVTSKVAYDGLKAAFTDQELKKFADEAGQSSFWTGASTDIDRYLNSDAAKQKYIDLLYSQYKAAGMAQ